MPGERDTLSEMFHAHLVGRDEEPPDLYVSVIGRCTSRGYFRYCMRNPCFHLRFMIRGKGWGETGGQRLPIVRDDLALFWPGDEVDLADTPDDPWDFVWVQLAGKNPSWAIQRTGFTPGARTYPLGAGNDLVPYATEVFEHFKRGGFHQVFPVAAAWQLLWRAADILGLKPDTGKQLGVAAACREYIRAHDRPVRIADLATHFGVSRSTLFRLFHEQYAMSPKDYIEQVRFEKACHLLAMTSLSVKEVAQRCHYDNAEYFSRRFRRKFNCTPRQWLDGYRRRSESAG